MSTIEPKDLRVAVLTGGWSDEREIAIASATAVRKALREAGFKAADLIDVAEPELTKRLLDGGYDVAFIAMHGNYGEDGCIQGLLEIMHIPYTFSNVKSSAVAVEKQLSKLLYIEAGIPIADGVELPYGAQPTDEELDGMVESLGLPLFVKPATNGSSFGISRVTEREQLRPAIELAMQTGGGVLVEANVAGTEITVPVIGNKNPEALPVVEIDPGADFYDADVKYEPSELHHIIPARLPEDVCRLAQDYAVMAHVVLGCEGVSRSDFIVTEDGEPVILETNTIPGMTETSLLPDSARHAGISFPELCRRFVELAFEAHPEVCE